MIVVRFRTSKGVEEIKVSLGGGATVRDLIVRLADEACGELEAMSRQVRDDPHAPFIVVVNGTNVRSLEGLETPVGDRDTVSILPVVGGGWASCP